MQKKDLELLWMFILRTAMYTGKEDKDTICAFIFGYEIGRDGECNFIERLMELIEEDYEIERKATGWIGQIEKLAVQLKTDWIIVFKKQSLRILTKEFNESTKKEFFTSFKKRINGKMSGVNHHFRRDWITDWLGIVDLTAEWFREMWSDKEIELMIEIENELRNYGNIRLIKEGVEPTVKLKIICSKMYKLMNKN